MEGRSKIAPNSGDTGFEFGVMAFEVFDVFGHEVIFSWMGRNTTPDEDPRGGFLRKQIPHARQKAPIAFGMTSLFFER